MSKKNNDRHDNKNDKDRDDGRHDHGGGKFSLLVGTGGDDVLNGSGRNDLIIGRKGDDWISGGAGNDILIGDGGFGAKGWHWTWGSWGKPKGRDDDYLDGGAGNDRILAGKGDDVANYTLSENKKAHDVYDGGKGFDTLQLTLTHAELQLASVQQDIAAFEAFLDKRANSNGDNGKTFEFKSFNLDVSNFEALQVVLLNAPPVAAGDSYILDEDAPLVVAGPGLLANDSDADGDALSAILVAGPAHGTLALDADGSFLYTPTANFHGNDSFTYKLSDGELESGVATVSLQVTPVNDLPAADDEAYTFHAGRTLSVPAAEGLLVGDTDVDGDMLNVVLLDITGLEGSVIGFADGRFDFTPTAGFVGATSFTYTVSDGHGGVDTATVTLNVTNEAPAADDEHYDMRPGQTLSVDAADGMLVGDVDADGDTLNVVLLDITGLEGSVIGFADGRFDFTPASGFVGSTSFTYTVSDGLGGLDTATVTIDVVNAAPVADDEHYTMRPGQTLTVSAADGLLVGDVDGDGDTLNVVLLDITGLEGSVIGFADGRFDFTPASGFVGSTSFTYTVSDGFGGADTATATIDVVNSAPVADDEAYSIHAGQTLSIPAAEGLIVGDTDADGDPLNVVLLDITGLQGSVTGFADGRFDFTPATGFVGSTSFTYTVSDGFGGSDTATVTLEVTNETPLAAGDAAATAEDFAVEGNVLANDTDGDGDALTALLVDGPAHGSLVFGVDGAFTYTPDANYHGADAFTYRASDGTVSSEIATVSLSVASVNDAPAAGNDEFTIDEDTSISSNVLANDVDADGESLVATLVQGPTHGVLTLDGDGNFTYTPEADYFGDDSFSYTAGDASGASSAATVSLTVNSVNDEPEAQDVDLGGGGGGGAVRVAVVGGGSNSTYAAVAAQIADSTQFEFDVDAINVTAFGSEAGWADMLEGYDVVVLGGSGFGNDYGNTSLFAALGDFVDAGGGVVTTGWFMHSMGFMSGQVLADADYITPLTGTGFGYMFGPGVVSIADPSHPIAGGLANYSVTALYHELAPALDATATVLATGGAATGGTLAAMAYDEVGEGLSAYLGSLHFGDAGYSPESLRSGAEDQLLERAVAWAAGPQSGGATTGQDSPYVISAAQLLAGATDTEGDEIFIESVSPFSELGAEVYIDENGNVVYDPSEGLKSLDEGEVVTDSFTYTLGNGQDAFGFAAFSMMSALANGNTGTVTLTVRGVNDAPDAVNDARSTTEDAAISGNVLANDLDPEGTLLTVTTAGNFTSSKGAAVTLNADGGYSYNPNTSATLQALNLGASTVDTFSYTVSDIHGVTDTATVSVTVAGRNESAPSSGKLLPQVDAQAELEYYIKFEGVSSDEWLRLDGFSMELANTVSLFGGGGAGAGKVTADAVAATLGSSKAILDLTKLMGTGKFLENVEIEAYRGGFDKDVLVDQYHFEDVLVTGLSTDGAPNKTSNDLEFAFTKFTHGHITYDDAKGGVLSTDKTGFDLAANKIYESNLAVGGDAVKGKQDLEAMPTGVELEYYVSFEGSGGWLTLDEFSMGLEVQGTVIGGGGAGAGKLNSLGGTLALGSSKQILELTDAITTGKFLETLEVEAYWSNGETKPQLVDQYYFEDVFITGLATEGAANEVGFEFAKFGHGHIELNLKGGAGPAFESGWDFAANKAYDPSHPVAGDVIAGKELPQVDAQAELEYYIKFEGVSSDEWLRLDGFSMELANTVSLFGGGGAGAGKVTADAVAATLGSSKAILDLTKLMGTGKFLENVEIEAYRGGFDKDVLVDQYHFEDVLVTGLSTDGAPNKTSNDLEFAFTKFTHGHITYDDAKGGVLSTDKTGFDLAANKIYESNLAVGGDAVKGKQDLEAMPTGVELEYYVSFEGSGGWLTLDEFSMGLEVQGTVIGGGGAGAGKLNSLGGTLALGSSKQILELTDAITTGKFLETLEVEAYWSNGETKPQLVDQYYFEDVFITGLATEGAANEVGFEFAKFGHGHIELNLKGGAGPAFESGWDFAANKAYDPSHPVAGDVIAGKELPQVDAQAELEYYIKFEGVSSDEWLRLDGFSMELANTVSLFGGGGAGAGKVTADAVAATLGSSKAILDLTKLMGTGKFLENVEIEAYRGGFDKDVLVDQYHFEDVLVTGLSTDGAPNKTSNDLEFAFTKFTHGHITYDDAKGGVLSTDKTGFDLAANKIYESNLAVGGDAVKGKQDLEAMPTGVELEYYVSFEGSGGWLTLDEFSMGLEVQGTVIGGGGAGAGKLNSLGGTLALGSSKQILELTDAITTGKFLETLEVEAYWSNGETKPQLVDQYYFEDVFITGLATEGAANEVGFEFAKFGHGHIELNLKGGAGPAFESGWDFAANKAYDPSHPVAGDVDLF